MPFDILPASNGEFVPPPATARERTIMRFQDEEAERVRRKLGLSRREFVRTAAAYAVGLWAIDQLSPGRFGRYAWAAGGRTPAACDLEFPGAQLNNLPGEFVFDVQTHHVESDGAWRVNNPYFSALFIGAFDQSAPAGGLPGVGPDGQPYFFGKGGEVDPIENLSRYHYLKELFLDSATVTTVLSAVPSAPDITQPLPLADAAETVELVNRMARSQRCVMHAMVMPNRGATRRSSPGTKPRYQDEEFELMEERAGLYRGILRGWKLYPPWGDVPYASGWFFDDDIGMATLERVLEIHRATGMPPVVAAHKGFVFPGFDYQTAACRDVGPAARQYPDVRFLIYHSGYVAEPVRPYPGDERADSAALGIDGLIKSLRENHWDAGSFVPPGLEHGNSPNVFAELGSTWRLNMGNPDRAGHLIGKLVRHVGPRRVVWGTDSLWFGSPQPEIVAFRALELTEEAKALYHLPYGLDGDRFDPTRNALSGSSYLEPHPSPALRDWPTNGAAHPERSIRNGILGRNAAEAYEIDPDAVRHALDCDEVQKMRDAYILNPATPRESAPYASNQVNGPRSRREFLRLRASQPWGP
jgi:predicted TIM-barrel fold metal-dependent hydrolase